MTEGLQTLHQPSGRSEDISFVEVVAAEFLIRCSSLQQVVSDGEDGARHRNDGSLVSANRG